MWSNTLAFGLACIPLVVLLLGYYAFGTELGAAGIPSRYGYQGEYAEKDSEPTV